MNVALDLTVLPVSDNVTACALIRTRTERGIRYALDGSSAPYENEVETGRYEFVACGEWVLVRTTLSRDESIERATWHAMTVADGRKLYKDLKSGAMGRSNHSPIFWGTWTPAATKVEILGTCETPARRTMHSWGEGANRVCEVDIPAQVGPVMRMGYGKVKALHSFNFTSPDNHRSIRTTFVDVDEKTNTARVYVQA